jgi:hypothetical protein
MATVYLLHFSPPGSLGGHYLAVAPGDVSTPPATIRRGTGTVQTPTGAQVADVWETADLVSAQALRGRLARQGSRRRLCSICSPGNARGAGRGNWRSPERTAAAAKGAIPGAEGPIPAISS